MVYHSRSEMTDFYSPASSLEIDTALATDTDSALGDGDSASVRTQSVTSSVYHYRFEDGRRYHAYQDGLYMLPNDDKEQGRLEIQHHLFRLTADGALHLAPLLKGGVHNVLDVGCGTGTWAIEFADENPSASVLGIDLSPIQPTAVPPNCSFRVDDAEADWIDSERFDFIHSRALVAGFKNWPRFFEQAFKHLNPGGYIELQDVAFPSQCDNPELHKISKHIQWLEACLEAGKKSGLDLAAPLNWSEQLRNAGFIDIHTKWFNWPIGPWAKHKKNKILGRWTLENFHEGLDSSTAFFTRVLGWKIEEAQAFFNEVRAEMKEQKIHLYQPVCFLYARKPEAFDETKVVATDDLGYISANHAKEGTEKRPGIGNST